MTIQDVKSINTANDSIPVAPPRQTIKDQIASKILDRAGPKGEIITTQAEFESWLAKSWYGKDNTPGKADVRNQGTAKAMLATWIEERLKAHDGVWFGRSDTQFTMGLLNRAPINVDCPAWMTAYINAYPVR